MIYIASDITLRQHLLCLRTRLLPVRHDWSYKYFQIVNHNSVFECLFFQYYLADALSTSEPDLLIPKRLNTVIYSLNLRSISNWQLGEMTK